MAHSAPATLATGLFPDKSGICLRTSVWLFPPPGHSFTYPLANSLTSFKPLLQSQVLNKAYPNPPPQLSMLLSLFLPLLASLSYLSPLSQTKVAGLETV